MPPGSRRLAEAGPAASPASSTTRPRTATTRSRSSAPSAVTRRRTSRRRWSPSRRSPGSTSSTPRTPTSPPRSRPGSPRATPRTSGSSRSPAACSSSPTTGDIQPIDTFLDYDALEKTLVPGLLESARLNGRVYGAPMRLANKSIVWYPKKACEAAGYQVPKTLAGAHRPRRPDQADGHHAVVHGLERRPGDRLGRHRLDRAVRAHASTVPTSTTSGPSHEIPFDDPQIVKAFDEFGKIAKTDGEVLRRRARPSSTPRSPRRWSRRSRNPPECMLERQGNFEISFLPADDPGRPRQRGRRLPVPAARGAARRRRRSSVAATSPRCSTATTRTPSRSWSS